MSFIRKYKKGNKVYLAEVESRRIKGKVVQRFLRYVGKQADGHTILSASISDLAESRASRPARWEHRKTQFYSQKSYACPRHPLREWRGILP